MPCSRTAIRQVRKGWAWLALQPISVEVCTSGQPRALVSVAHHQFFFFLDGFTVLRTVQTNAQLDGSREPTHGGSGSWDVG